ncbi:MAG: gliding motility-associated ABC transporter ATP-binding subunit GldA [Methylomicrobium sp.]
MDLIEAKNLYRYYGKYCAVDNVSFSLKKGQVLGFLGPNGAGKTTTLQMICGVLAPSSGQIIVNGFDLLDHPQQAKSKLGYLPDTPPLYRDLTVDEFLHYCARLHRLKRPGRAAAIERAKERCGLEAVGNRLIANLSKGFQQRIGIAQAILHNPEVVILDEPTVGLDPIQIRDIRSLIRELGHNHGVIFSTHILSEVQETCTDVQIIQKGRIVLHETIGELNRLMNTNVLQITTQAPVDFNALKAIPGVHKVEGQSGNVTRIHCDTAQNLTEHIADTVVRSGWGLIEITPLKKSIEDIFVALTQNKE